mmetsp:Transcript_37409/g.93962  ORF Transcript_37409/g.93962 Transcript_37409/m.93962 type:complete len:318 (-) Transcript_37409:1890-2843(-)
MELVVAADAREVHQVGVLARVEVHHGGSGHHLHLTGQQVGHQRALAGAWLADERHGQRHLAIQALAQGTQMREQAEHVLADAAHRTSASAGGCHAVVGHGVLAPVRLPVLPLQPVERKVLPLADAILVLILPAHHLQQESLGQLCASVRGSANRGQQRPSGAGLHRQHSRVRDQDRSACHRRPCAHARHRRCSTALCHRHRQGLSGSQRRHRRAGCHHHQRRAHRQQHQRVLDARLSVRIADDGGDLATQRGDARKHVHHLEAVQVQRKVKRLAAALRAHDLCQPGHRATRLELLGRPALVAELLLQLEHPLGDLVA